MSYAVDQSPLYSINSRKRLALRIFHCRLRDLEALAHRPIKEKYRFFTATTSGKVRPITCPFGSLKTVHARLFELLDCIDKPDYLHSAVKGRFNISNAEAHDGSRRLVKLDIKKFHPSVSAAHIYRFFREDMHCSPDVAGLLARLCSVDGHLPLGSKISQQLGFFAVRPMFDELAQFAQRCALHFTCFVDDLVFSGDAASRLFLWKAKQIIYRHGFEAHHTRCYTAKRIKLVTGVAVGPRGIGVPRGKEYQMWKDRKALFSLPRTEQAKALERLIGQNLSAGQIEPRFTARAERLMALRKERRLFVERKENPTRTGSSNYLCTPLVHSSRSLRRTGQRRH